MKRLYKKNKKVAIVFSLVMCLIIVGIGTVTSNASMNRYDEWMKKYLEYRAANKDLSNDQIAAMVDKEMSELQKSKETTVVELEATLCPGDMTKPAVTQSPEATILPQETMTPTITGLPDVTTYPIVSDEESTTVDIQNTLCPGDMTKPTVTETPDAVTIPAITPKPELKEEEKGSVSPCDCEECIAFYQIYQ